MTALSRTYTFSDGTAAYGSQVDSEIDNIASYIIARNAGTSSWDNVLIGTGGTSTGSLKLYNSANSNALTLSPASLSAARTYTFQDNGAASSVVVSQTAQKINGARPLGPRIFGLKVSRVSTSSNHVLWDYAVMTDSSGNVYVHGTAASIVTIDISSSGAINTLDTGTVANSTWYYIWLISDGTTTGGLYSTSSTAPTMPSGYTYKLLVGCVKTNGSAEILDSSQIQDYFYWVTPIAVVSNDTTNSGSLNSIDLTSAVPLYIAWSVETYSFLSATYSATGTRNLYATVARKDAGGGTNHFDVNLYQASAMIQGSGRAWTPIYNESAAAVKVDYTFAAGSSNRSSYYAYLYVTGFRVSTIL